MCQAKSRGGRRCPAHMSITRGSRTLAVTASGLHKDQVTSAFNQLREEGSNHPAPTHQQYAKFLQKQFDYINTSPMTIKERDAARKTLIQSTDENLPDGATFYALRKLTARSRQQSRALRREITELAPRMGATRREAARQFWQAYQAPASTEMSTDVPSAYTNDENDRAASQGLPRDAATSRAYSALREAASSPATNPNISTERRVELQPVQSSFISQIGYDHEDGRMEVTFSRNPEVIYAYRNVPASVWNEMNEPGASVGSIYSRSVRRNPDHAYASSEESESEAYARRCPHCGQFRASSHSCPESRGEVVEPRVEEPVISTPAPAQEPPVTLNEDVANSMSSQDNGAQDDEPTAEVTTEEEVTTSTPQARARRPRRSLIATRLAMPHEEREVISIDSGPSNSFGVWTLPESAQSGENALLHGNERIHMVGSVQVRNNVNRGHVVTTPVSFGSIYTDDEHPETMPTWRRSCSVAGSVSLYSDNGVWRSVPDVNQQLRCTCPKYRSQYRCEHVDRVRDRYASIAQASLDPMGWQAGTATDLAEGERPTINVVSSQRYRTYSTTNLPTTGTDEESGVEYNTADYIVTPNQRDINSALALGNAVVPVSWSGYRSADSYEYGHFNVSGTITMHRDENNQVVSSSNNLRCACRRYREEQRCVHTGFVNNSAARLMTPVAGTARAGITHQEVENARSRDWMLNEEHRIDMERRRAVVPPEQMYSQNFEKFNTDFEEAKAKIAAGESAVPFMRENATGGICAPDGGRKFGVELEFDISGVENKREALRNIGRELQEAGLTSSSQQLPYGSAGRNGAYDKWSFEQDCTVDGELVSPIMSDTPEDWAQLEKACEIIKRNGGTATTRAGSHVHVSTGSYGTSVATHAELAQMVNQNEDALYRLATNPERGTHRPMRWCAPHTSFSQQTIDYALEAERQGGYRGTRAVQSLGNSHGLGINFQSAGRGEVEKDNVEFRQWDSTLDPGVIQSQIKISAAMTEAAERNVNLYGMSSAPRENVGSHLTRQKGLLGRSRRALTEEEMKEDTATTRNLLDTLFTRPEDKKQIVGLFASTKWQKPYTR